MMTTDTATKNGPKINTHHMVCDFGKHKDQLYTRLPVSYLKWMISAEHPKAYIAEAELKRRGTTTPELELSGHAIDRASTECLEIWLENRNDGEGLNSWLCRVTAEAVKLDPDKNGRRIHLGMKFCFETDLVWPVLKTIMKA